MALILTLLAGLALGAVGGWWLARTSGAASLASARTESDLLRERVVDLEAAVSDDAQTAAALTPLRDALVRVEQQVGTLERDRTSQFAALETTIAAVHESTTALGRQTQSLAGSLNSSTVRGAWGEVQLRRVLEHSGLLARCDFDEQVRRVSRHQRQVRPDVVVRLPGDKYLVIDSKAPMGAFLAAQADDLPAGERDPSAGPRRLPEVARHGAGGQGLLDGLRELPRDGGLLRAERRHARRGPVGRPGPARGRHVPSGGARRTRARCSRCCAPSPSPGSRTP